MSLLERVTAALAAIPHASVCDLPRYGAACDCHRDELVAQRVTEALRAVWNLGEEGHRFEGEGNAFEAGLRELEGK